jgi:hypothetical protein
MLRFLWKLLIRKVAPRQLDAFAGRAGRPDWAVILRRGVTQGFLGGSTPWLVLGGVAALVRFWHKVGEDRAAVLLVEQLRPGQSMSIVDTGVERRRVPRALRQTDG